MVSPVITIFFITLILYCGTLLTFAVSYPRHRKKNRPAELPEVSIIISAHNEEKYLAACLKGILEQDYPKEKMQILVVNDASMDSTTLVADKILEESGIQHRILTNPSRLGKKKSISRAMSFAKHSFIVLRDADTFIKDKNWLLSIAYAAKPKRSMVIGPVLIKSSTSIIDSLQSFESAILMTVTGAATALHKPFLCSGANLAFSKELFTEAGGFSAHEHLRTGDDIFFLEAVKKMANTDISYAADRSAIVYTYPQKNIGSLLKQRARWASKIRYNTNLLNSWLAFLVFCSNFVFILAITGALFKPHYQQACLVILILKILFDLGLLYKASQISSQRFNLLALPVAFLYPIYAVATAVLALFINVDWKEE